MGENARGRASYACSKRHRVVSESSEVVVGTKGTWIRTDAAVGRAEAFDEQPDERRLWRFLRRTWWVIVAFVLLGALIASVISSREQPVYQAEAVVVASETTLVIDDFSDLAQAVFATDSVLRPVIDDLDLSSSPDLLLSGDHLALESISNAVAVEVVGRDTDPTLAVDLTNSAATNFAAALTDKGIGGFEVFETDEASTPERSSVISAVAGAAIGAVLSILVLSVILLVRQPVLTKAEAVQELDPDMAMDCRVSLPRRFPFLKPRRGGAHHRQEIVLSPQGIKDAIWRAANENGTNGSRCCFTVVEGRRRGDRRVRALLHELDVVDHGPAIAGDEAGHDGRPYWTSASEKTLGQAMEGAGAIAVVVSEGAPGQSVEAVADELRVRSDNHWFLIFVSPGR